MTFIFISLFFGISYFLVVKPQLEDIHNRQVEPLLLFDGICHLCNGVVNFIGKRNSKNNIEFVPIQSEKGSSILKKHGIPNDLTTIVLVESDQVAYTHSTAVLRLTLHMDYPWPIFNSLLLVPPIIRDFVYRQIAYYRYTIFGKDDVCVAEFNPIEHC